MIPMLICSARRIKHQSVGKSPTRTFGLRRKTRMAVSPLLVHFPAYWMARREEVA
jgi:hypothetical protein